MTTLTRLEAIRKLRKIKRTGVGELSLSLEREHYIFLDRNTGQFVRFENSEVIDENGEQVFIEHELTVKDIRRLIKQYFSHKPKVYVNAYEVHCVYGGPEEGGWWYDVSEPITSVPVIKTKDNVERVISILQESLIPEYEQPHGRTRFSVIGGPDLVISVEGKPAERWPYKPLTYS